MARKMEYSAKGDFYYNQVLTSHGVFGAHQERLFGKEGGCPCGEQLETIEHILSKCKIWEKEKDNWPKNWRQKDISDLVFYLPFKKGAIDNFKKLVSTLTLSWDGDLPAFILFYLLYYNCFICYGVAMKTETYTNISVLLEKSSLHLCQVGYVYKILYGFS
ncbi:hypothetical protein AVEN_188004-1 [Araneus ventricosus]|uniref:Uncharacterized protein n=1 Tax=Araneus ventricosus TaxID=182803 RepID=A0A4Y2HPZ1_ARAVE|nr:hypothetical protein AVEN_188004-1 [Araneus ventricosus]